MSAQPSEAEGALKVVRLYWTNKKNKEREQKVEELPFVSKPKAFWDMKHLHKGSSIKLQTGDKLRKIDLLHV